MKYQLKILAVIFTFIFVYAGISFIKMNIDFMTWGESVRSLFIIVAIIFSPLSIIIVDTVLEDKEDNK